MSETPGTRERIIEEATDLFASKGYEKTSLREVADRLGFTKAALYYHFNSKSDLARAIIEPVKQDIDHLLGQARMEEGIAPRVLFERIFDVYHPHLPIFRLLLRDASILSALDLEAWSSEWLNAFQKLLVGEDAAPEKTVRAVAALSGLLRATVLVVEMPIDTVRAAVVDAACGALGVE